MANDTIIKLYKEEDINEIVRANLEGAIGYLNLTQKDFAKLLGVSAAALSGYLRGNNIPPLYRLVNLCLYPPIKNLNITVQKFLLEPIDFKRLAQIAGTSKAGVATKASPHKDFVGNYIMYYFEQPQNDTGSVRAGRNLKYGVLSIIENFNHSGDNTYRALARIYKTEQYQEAMAFKATLDATVKIENINEKTNKILDAVTMDPNFYDGSLTFSSTSAFINLISPAYGDNALIVLSSPERNKSREYIGGLGCVASVTRGEHIPSSQKIILSRYDLLENHSCEELGEFLFMVPNEKTDSIEEEAGKLIEFFNNVYSRKNEAEYQNNLNFLTPKDCDALFRSRIRQLISNHVRENYWAAGYVTKEDDARVYRMLKMLKKTSSDS